MPNFLTNLLSRKKKKSQRDESKRQSARSTPQPNTAAKTNTPQPASVKEQPKSRGSSRSKPQQKQEQLTNTKQKQPPPPKHSTEAGAKKPSFFNIKPSRRQNSDLTDSSATDGDDKSDTTTKTWSHSVGHFFRAKKRPQTKPGAPPLNKKRSMCENKQNWIEPSAHILARKKRKMARKKRKTKKDMPTRPPTSPIARAADHTLKESASSEEFVRPVEDERNLRPATFFDDQDIISEDERTPEDDTLYGLPKQMKEYGRW